MAAQCSSHQPDSGYRGIMPPDSRGPHRASQQATADGPCTPADLWERAGTLAGPVHSTSRRGRTQSPESAVTSSLTWGRFSAGSQQGKNEADAAREARRGPRWKETEWEAGPRKATSQAPLGWGGWRTGRCGEKGSPGFTCLVHAWGAPPPQGRGPTCVIIGSPDSIVAFLSLSPPNASPCWSRPLQLGCLAQG